MQYPIVDQDKIPAIKQAIKEYLRDEAMYEEACKHPENFELHRWSYPIEHYAEAADYSLWELKKLIDAALTFGEI